MTWSKYSFALSIAIGLTGEVRADYVTYTDRGTFAAATGNLRTIGFEGLAPSGGFADYGTPSGLTLQGVNFVGTIDGDNSLYVVDPAFSPTIYDWGSGAVLLGPSLAFSDIAQINITLPPGTTAVGMDLMSIVLNADGTAIVPDVTLLQVNLGSGPSFSVYTDDYPQRAFFGVTSDEPIESLSISTRPLVPTSE